MATGTRQSAYSLGGWLRGPRTGAPLLRGVVWLVGVFSVLKKAQPQAVINTSKSDLTIKINIQKNLSVHTSERISNTFTQKIIIIKALFIQVADCAVPAPRAPARKGARRR